MRRLVLPSLLLALGAALAGQAPARTVWDGVYTAEQAAAGQQIYGESCASCHGGALGGAEAAPALVGAQFAATWNGTTLNDLAERIRVSMPADDPGSLGRRDVASVVAYVLSAGGFPAGEFELGRQAEVLQQIAYVSTPPD